MHGLVVEFAFNIVIVGNGLESEELPEAGESLNFGEFSGEKIVLKLQHLQLDLEEVALAHVAGFITRLADVHSPLEAIEILLGKIDGGLREEDSDELLGKIEDELAFIVSHCKTRSGGLVLCGLQAMLALLAELEGVAEAQVKLRLVVKVIGAELTGLENGEELCVPGKNGVRAEIGSRFLGLILQDGGARGLQSMVVLQSQADGFLDGDTRGRERCICGSRWRSCGGNGFLLGRRESG